MHKKIPIFFFIIVYFNQGIFDLSSQAIYYLLREKWLLSASLIGLFGFITSLAWYSKILFGYITDRITNHKSLLQFNYLSLLLLYSLIIVLPLNFYTLLFIITLINLCVGSSDVICDKYMAFYENTHKLNGRGQCVQWAGLYVAALIASLLGAWLSDAFDAEQAIKWSYLLVCPIPIITLIYLKRFKNIFTAKQIIPFKKTLSYFKNPQILMSLLFIACLQLCPSFGTPLMIQMREVLAIDKMFMGYISASGIIFSLLGYFLYYKRFYKLNLKALLYFTVIFSAVTNLFYLYIPSQWHILGYGIMFGAFSAITHLAILSFFVSIVPKNNEGMVYACITALSNLCAKMSGVLGGFIYDHSNYAITVIVSTVLTVCCLFFLPRLHIGLDNT